MTSYLDTLRQIRVEIPGRPKAVFDDFARDVWEQLIAVAEAAESVCFCGDCEDSEALLRESRVSLRAAVEAREKGQS